MLTDYNSCDEASPSVEDDFRLTLGDRSVVVKGRVVHSSISDVEQELITYRSGIEFVDPPDRVFSAIAEFVDAIKMVRKALT